MLEPRYREIFSLLVGAGVELEIRDCHGLTALHFAMLCWSDVIAVLLDAGADVHAVDGRGNTPLRMAAFGAPGNGLFRMMLRSGEGCGKVCLEGGYCRGRCFAKGGVYTEIAGSPGCRMALGL